MKKPIKIYLEPSDEMKLKLKAEGLAIEGRGWLSLFLHKIAVTPMVLLDENLTTMLEALQLQPNGSKLSP